MRLSGAQRLKFPLVMLADDTSPPVPPTQVEMALALLGLRKASALAAFDG
jgi:hypothetical protein